MTMHIRFLLLLPFLGATLECQAEDKVLSLGSRRELFADHHLISKLTGDAKLELQKPQPQEVVLVTDKPWEGNTCAYYTVFRDGNKYRMYYRGSHAPKRRKDKHREVTCYAESSDGIHWDKPELGLYTFNGSKKNNIVWDGIGTHCFTPFKDQNPHCAKDALYKAVGRGRPRGKRGLYVFKSADGIHWKPMSDGPVITRGAFDSQNLAFWDPERKLYVCYFRTSKDGKRFIKTCTSKDFLHWTDPVFIEVSGAPHQHLYTNAVLPYPRAPHLKIGFPTRYFPDSQQVEPTFMISRDGLHFFRWSEPVIPRTAPKDRDGNRSNYMTWGLVQLPGKDDQYSVYGTEAYYEGPSSRVRRFTYRVDGFVAVRAGAKGGELVTKPFTFDGNTLTLNFKTGSKGSIRVELLDAKGKTIPGFEAKPLTGNSIDESVKFKDDLSRLAGKVVRARFILKDANLYSLRFAPSSSR